MIAFSGVTHRYGKLCALSNLTLEIPAGVHGLLGQNGAGKTTLLRTLATLHHPQIGEVRMLGLNPRRHNDRLELRSKLGYLPQDFMPYPNFSAFEFVEYIAILKGVKQPARRRARVMEVLAMVGLEHVATRKAGGFSGGMRRRLGIAQALVNRPEMLIVDEPTASLDPAERVRFRHLLASSEARVTVFSTHIVEDVSAVAPLVSVLHKSALVYQGAPEGLCKFADGCVFHDSTMVNPAKNMVIAHVRGGHRVLTRTPSEGAVPLEPTVEEGYLALVGGAA